MACLNILHQTTRSGLSEASWSASWSHSFDPFQRAHDISHESRAPAGPSREGNLSNPLETFTSQPHQRGCPRWAFLGACFPFLVALPTRPRSACPAAAACPSGDRLPWRMPRPTSGPASSLAYSIALSLGRSAIKILHSQSPTSPYVMPCNKL